MSKAAPGLQLSASQAKNELSAKKPLTCEGGVRIEVRGILIKLYGVNKPTQDGQDSYQYTVFRPTVPKNPFYSNMWPKVVEAIHAEILRIEKKANRLLEELWDIEALRYRDVMERGKECHDLPSVLALLQAVGNMIGKTLPPALVEVIQSVELASKKSFPMPVLVASGIELEEFAAKRAFIPRQQVLSYFAKRLPEASSLPSNKDLIEEFLMSRADRSEEALEQYELRLTHFDSQLKKPFFFTEPEDVADYIKDVIENFVPGEGYKNADSKHDQIIDIIKNFFNWQIKNRKYPKEEGNPVAVTKKGNRNREPNPEHILETDAIQQWLDGVRFEDVPYLVLLVKLGVRAKTILRLTWEDIDWENLVVIVGRTKSKCGKARPRITPEVLAMLEPYRGCVGPIVLHSDTPIRVRKRGLALGIVKERFNNNGRKSCISYTYPLGPVNTIDPLRLV